MKRLFFILCLAMLLFTSTITSGASQSEVIPLDSGFTATISGSHSNISALTLPEIGTFNPQNPTYGAQLEDPVAIDAYQKFCSVTPDTTQLTFSYSQPLDWPENAQDQTLLLNNLYVQYDLAFSAALSAFMFDHPEQHYFTPGEYRFDISSPDFETFDLLFTYNIVQNPDSRADKAAMDAAVTEFCQNFDRSLSTMEQYRAIHDYICSLATYDYTAADCKNPSHDHSISHSAYGLLVHDHPVVCEGYAKAFKVLCDALDLPCMLIVGEGAANYDEDADLEFIHDVYPDAPAVNTNHMWNAVEVDNNWYAVDTTWDDSIDGIPLSSDFDFKLSLVSYHYFLNNVPFLAGDAQDHISSGEIYFSGYYPMQFSLPPLTEGSYPGADSLIPEELTITFTSDNMDLPDNLWDYSIDGLPLSDIDRLNLRLTQDVALTHSIAVPAEKIYTLDSIGGTSFALNRTQDFHGPLFTVSGTLELENVSPSPALDTPLAALQGTGSVSDASNRCVIYDGKSPVSINGYRASYDQTGKMVSLHYMGAIRFTTPGLYLFPNEAVSTKPGAAEKQFLLRTSTFAPLSPGPL